ncbi:MAG: alpha/beta fold hydrolase [Marinilabiliales bacterium]|nr:alpha/beta fold hydrolase [Marinilabiliales bacterium]
MKKLGLAFLMIFVFGSVWAADISGQWNGLLKVNGLQLRIVFHVEKSVSGYTATMDSPDQGAKGIPVTSITFEANVLKMEVASAGLSYEGALKEAMFTGMLRQHGMQFPLDLSREMIEKQVVRRPQEPKPPFPYQVLEVNFENPAAGIRLSGTLTLPASDKPSPAVILITGSGPQNRDEEIFGHKPFWVIADYLSRHGIAVLRYDDRGVAASTGDFKVATTADFASDVVCALSFLKGRREIDSKRIGLVGHSEGGMIAPLVAAQHSEVNFIVMLAGLGLTGERLLLLQQERIARASGADEKAIAQNREINEKAFSIVLATPSAEERSRKLSDFLLTEEKGLGLDGKAAQEKVALQIKQLTTPWMVNFLSFDPIPYLKRVKCPVLALNGDKDLQVPSKENLAAIGRALQEGHNKNGVVKELPGLNHLFQECKTGLPAEYGEIEMTLSPDLLRVMTEWIGGLQK